MNAHSPIQAAPVDFAAVKTKQQAAWASGDYAVVGTTLQIVGEQLAEACDINWDQEVLDVAAGNGNVSLAAARRGARVTSSDYVPALLERGAQRAAAEGLKVAFQTADAEDLPFGRASFDAVVSTFGVMFTPNHKQAAEEMARVCRPGGKIGLANWTPDGFIGQLFKVLGKHMPPPAGVQPPSLWGTEAHLRELFGSSAASIVTTKRHFTFRYRSPKHFVEVFRTWYGPTHKAFAALGDKGPALEADLIALMDKMASKTSPMVLPSEYLEAVITRA